MPVDEWHGFDYQGTAGERCDVAVTLHLRQKPEYAELSRARVQALIEEGGVRVEGRDVLRAQKNLRPGMHVDVNLTMLSALLNPPAPQHVEPVEMPLNFLHVDEHLVVVEKPAGLTVHPAPTEEGPTLTAALVHHFGQLSDYGGGDRPGIVHRLDKETSGLLVVARDNPTHVALSRQFAERTVEKEYVALTIDEPERPAGTIDAPIERHPRQRQKMWAGGRGRDALTEYRLREHWGALALLEVAIHTGRTHQIRVHLLTVGACILNDDKYGGGRNGSLRKFLRDGGGTANRRWKQAWPEAGLCRRLLGIIEDYPGIFLHARRLSFTHPASGERLEFNAELPEAWEQVRGLSAMKSA